MQFYQVKMIRKGIKPSVWRRCLVPTGLTFAQMAVVLEELLEYDPSDQYEYEFFQRKIHIREWTEGERQTRNWQYDYYCAPDTMTAPLMDEEKWFTFRIRGEQETPEYRVEIEKKLEGALVGKDKRELLWPAIMKEKDWKEDGFWGDAIEQNTYLEKAYMLTEGPEDYRPFRELAAGISGDRIVLAFCPEGKSRTERNEKSSSTYLQEFVQKLQDMYDREYTDQRRQGKNTEENETESRTEETTRNPTMRELFETQSREELADFASELGLRHRGLNQKELAEKIANELLSPEVIRRGMMQLDEWEMDAFRSAVKQGLFRADEEEQAKLSWLTEYGYVAVYDDDMAEVPQEVIQSFAKIDNEDFRMKHGRLCWIKECIMAAGFLYVVTPLQILYRMFRKRSEYRTEYEEFRKLLDSIPEEERDWEFWGEKIVLRQALEEEAADWIEEEQEEWDFYIPSVEEVLDLAEYKYPAGNKAYLALKNYLQASSDAMWAEGAEILGYFVYKIISKGEDFYRALDMLEESALGDISRAQRERLTELLVQAYNHTRMYLLRGHTPEEAEKIHPYSYAEKIPEKYPEEVYDDAPCHEEPLPDGFMPFMPYEDAGKPVKAEKKIYPNDPCPCGSGKKYKKCCGRK